MKVSDLFSAEMEPGLNDWVRKFDLLGDLFSAMPQLYANLRAQNVQGIIEDGAIIIGAVHIGMGSVVHAQTKSAPAPRCGRTAGRRGQDLQFELGHHQSSDSFQPFRAKRGRPVRKRSTSR
jgi:hypothetical protein